MATRKTSSKKNESSTIEGSEGGYTSAEGPKVDVSAGELESLRRSALETLEGEEKEKVQLINLTMGDVTFYPPAESGMGMQKCTVSPFQLSPAVPVKVARSLLTRKKASRFGNAKNSFYPLPDVAPPNYRGEQFKDPVSGQVLLTNKYRPRKGTTMPNGRPMYHSVEQAHHFLSRLTTTQAIRRFIRDFDPRPEVTAFASLVMDFRERQRLESLGYSSVEPRGVLN